MKAKGLAEIAEVLPIGKPTSKNKVFVYHLLLDPEEYLRGIRTPRPRVPKSTHYNNPFNLKGVTDMRLRT
jgi:hypothetical protein